MFSIMYTSLDIISNFESCNDEGHYICNESETVDHYRQSLQNCEITVKEAIFIKRYKPSRNKQLCTQGSSFVLNIF